MQARYAQLVGQGYNLSSPAVELAVDVDAYQIFAMDTVSAEEDALPLRQIC